ncbi:MAG: hypothetical protein JRG68_01365 [Deltaproteobacteria bacterium]|nr:hypothetical protein [Deltaproteobacteria bacterium]MBW1940683.1 hypothetical protein [Deltaproteobacteria bacterium]MBW2010454.1 hypothetical protein [Deltaproteobacteria bacterium]MBW2099410.1 hypothetical protein [Deltaproteobacteria bacterium]
MKEKLNKRIMERFSIKLPSRLSVVRESGEQESFELLTDNICAGGAFFKTRRSLSLSVGTKVKIGIILVLDELKMPKLKKTHIKVSGTVIRTAGKGIAISFDKNFRILPYKLLTKP